ncbi:MAG: glycosyltransferase [Oscillospiraceae bacterium]|nr:glycosyltransferase [Bacteroidales bacterium]MBQ9761489.1 glycosyltransferase [Oscillospiraceae bacterium]
MGNKKKIAIISNDMCMGGIEKSLVGLSKVLDYDHYQFDLYLNSTIGPLLQELDPRLNILELARYDARQCVAMQMGEGKIWSATVGIFERLLARSFAGDYERNAYHIARAMPKIEKEYDCTIAYYDRFDTVVTALCRFRAKKYVFWIHGMHDVRSDGLGYRERIYSRFHRAIFVSEATRDNFCKSIPSMRDRAKVIHNIVDVEQIREKGALPLEIHMKRVSLLTVGRLSHEKGQDMIPAVIRTLLDKGHDIYWYLIGDGGLAPQIREQARKYSVEDRTILLGMKNDPYPFIKNCDIYVQTSRLEGWCLTTQEAKILGKPVVTTALPVMKEQIVHGENGLIASDITPEALAEQIDHLLANSVLQRRIQENLASESFTKGFELSHLYEILENEI